MSINDDSNSKIQQMKEYLSTIYYELLSEIKGKPITPQDKTDKALQSTRIPKQIEELKETIQLLLEKRIDDYKASFIKPQAIPNSNNTLQDFESQLRQYENILRKQYKRELISKIKISSAKHRIECYEGMEDDFEEMKEKLKYEDGQFLNNDRKEHEILILRAENSNLKEVSLQCIKKKEEKDSHILRNQETILKLKARIEKLTKKIDAFDKNKIEIESQNKSSIYININNGNSASKWVIKGDEENPGASLNTSIKNKKISEGDKHEPPNTERCNKTNITNCIIGQLEAKLRRIHNSKISKRQQKNALVDSSSILNKFNSYLNDYDDKADNSSQGKLLLHKTSSIGNENAKKKEMINFNANFNNLSATSSISKQPSDKYVKISHLIPVASKMPSSSKMQHQKFESTMNKMYMLDNSMNKNTNRSSLNLRSNSKLHK